jgi:hypothetical protein
MSNALRWCSLMLDFAPHAQLLARYDMATQQLQEVGHRMGQYARETEDGAEFHCLGVERNGAVTHSAAERCGPFYPATLHLTGEDGVGDQLSMAILTVVASRIWSFDCRRLKRVVLPKGYVNGKATWWYGLQFERAGEWWYMRQAHLAELFSPPACEVTKRGQGWEVFIEDMYTWLAAGFPSMHHWLDYAPKAGECIINKETGGSERVAFLDGNLACREDGTPICIWRFQDGLNNLHTWESKQDGPEAP